MTAPPENWIPRALLDTLSAESTDAHRLFSGHGGWVERFGADALVSWRAAPLRDRICAELGGWARAEGLRIDRIFERELPRQPEARSTPTLASGDPALPLETVVLERATRFRLDFSAGYSVGLFPDQRANRALLRQCRPRRLLNLFAYTCAFSVAAALEGARTTSADLSRKSLDRGRRNFEENGLDPGAHRFFADDVLRLLPRLARQNEKFDAIILDPPTFSRGEGGKAFRVERDLPDLALAALDLLEPRGRLLLSTNCARMEEKDLRAAARYALKAARRAAELHSEPPPPDFPPGHGARTLWMMLKD